MRLFREFEEKRYRLIYEPCFDPDGGDVTKLEAITERLLEILPEPKTFGEDMISRIDAIVEDVS